MNRKLVIKNTTKRYVCVRIEMVIVNKLPLFGYQDGIKLKEVIIPNTNEEAVEIYNKFKNQISDIQKKYDLVTGARR